MNIEELTSRERILVLGHRGSPMKEIENTIRSFKRAMEDGADGVELDVHLSDDGNLVVIHDFNTKRVFGTDSEIEELTIKEIKAINSEIPTLEEVFEALGPVYYDIEIKADFSFDKKLISTLTGTLNNYPQIADRVMVSSFNPLAMRAFWKMNKGKYPLGLIYEGPPTTVPVFLQKGQGRILFQTDYLKPKWDIAEREFKNKKGKYPLCPWTVDSIEVLEKMLPIDPFAVVTNEPEKIVAYLREH